MKNLLTVSNEKKQHVKNTTKHQRKISEIKTF